MYTHMHMCGDVLSPPPPPPCGSCDRGGTQPPPPGFSGGALSGGGEEPVDYLNDGVATQLVRDLGAVKELGLQRRVGLDAAYEVHLRGLHITPTGGDRPKVVSSGS